MGGQRGQMKMKLTICFKNILLNAIIYFQVFDFNTLQHYFVPYKLIYFLFTK